MTLEAMPWIMADTPLVWVFAKLLDVGLPIDLQHLPQTVEGEINMCSSCWGFPGGSDSKESACNGGDPGSTSESRRSPGEGNGYPLQYSCLENSMDRGAWEGLVHSCYITDGYFSTAALPCAPVNTIVCLFTVCLLQKTLLGFFFKI